MLNPIRHLGLNSRIAYSSAVREPVTAAEAFNFMSIKKYAQKMETVRRILEQNGIVTDENGQYQFADLIFFDPDMSAENKIVWLKECAGQETRISELEKQLQEAA